MHKQLAGMVQDVGSTTVNETWGVHDVTIPINWQENLTTEPDGYQWVECCERNKKGGELERNQTKSLQWWSQKKPFEEVTSQLRPA